MSQEPGASGSSVPDVSVPSIVPTDGTMQSQSQTQDSSGNLSLGQRQKLHGTEHTDRRARPSDISVPAHGSAPRAPVTTLEPSSPPRAGMAQATAAARRSSSPFGGGASPSRIIRSSSPRHLSPATSQIFERDVQEPAAPPELSPAIPSHIQTEDHIPPVLEASSLAITDDHLNPDDVEIVMHSAHQPAAVVTGSIAETHSPLPPSAAHPTSEHPGLQPLNVPHDPLEGGSSYGAVDPMDPRRLSFVSFADVVHSEHAEPRAESIGGNQSPSPVHSPASLERIPMSPPTSVTGSSRGLEVSPSRAGAASPGSLGPVQHGELTIETMRQTLQKTGNNDAAGGSSLPLSASSVDDGRAPRSFR